MLKIYTIPKMYTMPNPDPDTSGLTRSKGRALEALGVEALAPGERSFVVRVRGREALEKRLQAMSPKEIGKALERRLELAAR